MNMRLTSKSGSLLTLLAASFLIVPAAAAQAGKPIKKHAHKARAAAHAPENPTASPAPSADNSEPSARRDPFVPLINLSTKGGNGDLHLPPGKAGLVISSVRVDGAVSSPDGMIAVVSNPEDHVYFIREGDHLYDGEVEKIGLDGVTFRENTKDAFGKAVERTVTKRIFASAGEQQ
jgi:Tfp pilus assembly protein PilP